MIEKGWFCCYIVLFWEEFSDVNINEKVVNSWIIFYKTFRLEFGPELGLFLYNFWWNFTNDPDFFFFVTLCTSMNLAWCAHVSSSNQESIHLLDLYKKTRSSVWSNVDLFHQCLFFTYRGQGVGRHLTIKKDSWEKPHRFRTQTETWEVHECDSLYKFENLKNLLLLPCV